MKLVAIIAAVLVYLGFQTKAKVQAESPSPTIDFLPAGVHVKTLDTLYQAAGQRWGIDWLLLKAVAQVESNENPDAKNPNDPSYGLMQVLCVPDGQGSCSNKLNVLGWPPQHVGDLYDPEYSLKIGAQILAWNIEQYGMLKGIATYNHWGARKSPNDGPFPNQGYVDKVLSKYRNLGGYVGSVGQLYA